MRFSSATYCLEQNSRNLGSSCSSVLFPAGFLNDWCDFEARWTVCKPSGWWKYKGCLAFVVKTLQEMLTRLLQPSASERGIVGNTAAFTNPCPQFAIRNINVNARFGMLNTLLFLGIRISIIIIIIITITLQLLKVFPRCQLSQFTTCAIIKTSSPQRPQSRSSQDKHASIFVPSTAWLNHQPVTRQHSV